jgi:hypothetical protein
MSMDTNLTLSEKQIAYALAEHAEVIRAAGRATIENVLEIGQHLTEAKKLCGYGNWSAWLDEEFGWSDDTALNFMRVYDLSNKGRNFRDLSLPVSSLYLLAQPTTPEAARQEVFNRAESGEPVSYQQTRDTIAKHKRALRPPYVPPVVRQDLIDQAMTLIRQMREIDFNTWAKFDRIYQKAREQLAEIPF